MNQSQKPESKVYHLQRLVRDKKTAVANHLSLRSRLLCVFILSNLILFLMYWRYRAGVYAQDDPGAVEFFTNENLSPLERIFSTGANRWRPVTYFFEMPLVYAVKNSYSHWLVASIAISALAVTYIYYVFFKMNKNFYTGAILVLLIVTSRFFTGIILNLTFILETISLILLIALAEIFRRNWTEPTFIQLKYAVVLYAALVFTHERYIGLNLFFIFYFLLHNQFVQKYKLIYLFLFSLPTMSLFLIKAIVLGIPIFVGTGSSTDVGFSFSSSLVFLSQLLLGLIGINFGYEYLHGYTFQNQTESLRVTSVGIALITLCLLGSKMFTWIKRRPIKLSNFLKVVIVYVSLFASLAIPVIATIRIEHRWFLPVYVILLFVLFADDLRRNVDFEFGKLGKTLLKCILAIFISLNLLMNFTYIQNIGSLYFMSTQRAVKIQLDSLEKIKLDEADSQEILYLIDPNNQIDLQGLNLAIDANLVEFELDVVRISLPSDTERLPPGAVIEIDPDKPDGSFRKIK